MATAVVMPKQGQSVESCIIVDWKKEPGDPVVEGEPLCEVETDKAVLEVPSPATGTLLARFYEAGAEVPVLTTIAAIGEPGEDISHLQPAQPQAQPTTTTPPPPEPASPPPPAPSAPITAPQPAPAPPTPSTERPAISPRASRLAIDKGLDIRQIPGSGPGGRIIERDVLRALETQPTLTPVARAKLAQGGYVAPARGSGPRGRITARDLIPAPAQPEAEAEEDIVQTIPLKGIRKLIAERMRTSLQTTAQLTLNASADASRLQAFRQRLKNSNPTLDLQQVTINDLLLFVVSRVLPHHPALNAVLTEDTITQYRSVHLAFAVDTPRGLMVPVIRHANHLSLQQIAQESRRLANACQEGTITPDELAGGTFTVTNLGNLGIESFTPILNPPQVAILGIGAIEPKPVQKDDQIQFVPHIALSLTIDHQAVDGAPGARFLKALAQGIADIELMIALG